MLTRPPARTTTLTYRDIEELSHEDRLQRTLAYVFAKSVHAHTCAWCGKLRICTVIDCPARKFPVVEREWTCFECRGY